jgi:hypothetical protein
MRTAYAERTAFVEKLQELFAKIDDLNRPTPMNEGEYLDFANLIKDLNKFAELFKKNDPIYIRLVASARRGERKATQSVIAKAEDKNYKWCERCDTHIKKKGWAKHRRSERCIQIFNSKKLAVNITNVEKHKVGRFAKTPIHPFYMVGQSLVSQLGKNKAKDAEQMNAEWDAVRLPIQTQQLEDEVGTLESFYEPQEDFSSVFANVPAERNLTLALILPEPEVVAEQPKKKRVYKKKPKVELVLNPTNLPPFEITENVVLMCGAPPIAEIDPAERRVLVIDPEVVAEQPKKKRAYKKKPKPEAEVVAPAEVVAEVVAEPEPEPVVEVVPEVPRRYVEEGVIDKQFYETYLREHMSEKGQSKMDGLFNDEEYPEEFVEYRVCSWGNPKDHINEYSELWFLDCEGMGEDDAEAGKYYPLVVGEINTSSYYAMCRSGMGRDAETEEEEANLMLTDEEIVALVRPRNHERILNLLQSKRKDGK